MVRSTVPPFLNVMSLTPPTGLASRTTTVAGPELLVDDESLPPPPMTIAATTTTTTAAPSSARRVVRVMEGLSAGWTRETGANTGRGGGGFVRRRCGAAPPWAA